MKSSDLFARAKTLMPGGVSSPVRAIRPYPFYVERAAGSHITTVDGADLIDCCLGYGPLIFGHAHPVIREAIERQLERGWLYGTPSPLELDLAEIITGDHPGIDMIRFVSSGSEATMAAIRLARGYTGKQDIVKVEGGFHGAHDAVLVKAGSGATTLGVPDSAGVLADLTAHTRQVPYNDPEALEAILAGNDDVAAFILEPIMGNIGPILPDSGYLADVREITAAHGVLLILDEVITGYRVGIGGAEVLYGVKPDIATFGKIIGGGLPIGAFGGRRDIMDLIAPSDPSTRRARSTATRQAFRRGLRPSVTSTTIRIATGGSTTPRGRSRRSPSMQGAVRSSGWDRSSSTSSAIHRRETTGRSRNATRRHSGGSGRRCSRRASSSRPRSSRRTSSPRRTAIRISNR